MLFTHLMMNQNIQSLTLTVNTFLDNSLSMSQIIRKEIREAMFKTRYHFREAVETLVSLLAGKFMNELWGYLKYTKNGEIINNERGVYNTYEWWCKKLKCKRATFSRMINKLRDLGLVYTLRRDHPWRRNRMGQKIQLNYYFIDQKVFELETNPIIEGAPPSAHFDSTIITTSDLKEERINPLTPLNVNNFEYENIESEKHLAIEGFIEKEAVNEVETTNNDDLLAQTCSRREDPGRNANENLTTPMLNASSSFVINTDNPIAPVDNETDGIIKRIFGRLMR